jgi:hypothetical protein
MIANPLALLLIVVVTIVLAGTILEMAMKHHERKGWINGVDYDVEEFGTLWITARMVADDEKKEFEVAYNPEDGHFYDKSGTGYHATEIYIKKENE